MPLIEAAGKEGTGSPAQMETDGPKLNVGVILGLTVTENVAIVAHCPAAGVKVYVPEFWSSTTAGLHVPLIPLPDVLGSNGTVPLPQITSEVPNVNVGVMLGMTVTFMVAGKPHWPAVGVKIYDPEAWLSITEGLQVPLMPLVDVVGKGCGVEPAQKGVILLNFGVNTGFDKISPVLSSVVQPFVSITNSE